MFYLNNESNGAVGNGRKLVQTSSLVLKTVRYILSLGLVSRQLVTFSSLPVYEFVTLTLKQHENRGITLSIVGISS